LLTIIAGIYSPSKDLWANILGNEYFFPPSPTEVVEGLDLHYRGDDSSIVGKVKWKSGRPIDIANYRVVTYLEYRNESPFYNVHKFVAPIHGGGSETELAKISDDGSFMIPSISKNFQTQGNVLQGSIVAIITRLDGEPLRRYPPGITDKNAIELTAIRASVKALELRDAQQAP
jgi:hypothetical protein